MVLTDVTDPNGPYYTDTLTNVVVFDRAMLASANRDQILNALGHEFGHYSKEDDIDKSQDIANHTGKLLEDRTRGMVAKEATEDTLARIRNNLNVITGEEGKKLAESIPMDRREYVKWERVFRGTAITFSGGFRTFLGISEIGLGAASSSVGVGVLVVGHGIAQTGFGISETVEGLDHSRLGFIDISEEEREALSLSKKLLGKYEEALNFAVGGTTSEVATIGQAYGRVPKTYPKVEHTKESQGKNQKGIIVSSDSPDETSNKMTVNKIDKNSNEVVYKEKDIKINILDFSSKPNTRRDTISEIKGKGWSKFFENKAIRTYEDFEKEGLEVSSHFVVRFINRKDKNLTQEKVIKIYKNEPINYKEKIIDKKSPKGYKINNIRYYDNIRVITNENDTELITVVKDKFDKSEVNVKYGKWDKVK